MTLLCFRCDRRVSGRPGGPCPSCGAELVVEGPRRPRPDRHELGSPVAEDGTARVSEPGSGGERRPRGPRSVVGLVVALALVGGVLVVRSWVPGEPDAPVAPPVDQVSEPLGGRLVYVAEGDRPAERRLWVVNLATGTKRRGPVVGDVLDLVDLSEVHPGWLGVEVAGADGSVLALALRGLDAASVTTPLARGELVAWGPGGQSLAVATRSRTRQGCRGVRIDLVSVRTGSIERGRAATGVCGPLLTLGRSAVASYFTAETSGGVDTFFSGSVGVPHLLFGNTRMLSASPLAQFLVTAPAARAEVGTDELLYLAWRGRGGPLPVRLGPEPLEPEAVVAWSSDGSFVALVGTVAGEPGLYVVTAGSGSGVREPDLVSAGEVLDATFATDGTLFVARRGEIRMYRDGRLEALALPAGAPPPAGPVAWLP